MLAPLLISLLLAQADGSIRLDVTQDTWLSDAGREADGSNGGSPRLKLKSIQEFTLLDIDPNQQVLKERAIRSATLHVKSTGAPILKRVTVGALASPFREGTSTNYEAKAGDSTFLHRTFPNEPWTADGGDICNVLFGARGALWGTADASPPDSQGWQAIPVEPRVIAARLAGISGGFVAFDDTGTEWTRQGDKFTRILFPNRFIYSREQNRSSAPYFTVTLGPKDGQPPAPVSDLKVEPETASLPPGEAIVSWTTPEDRGPSGLLGFVATIDGAPAPLDVIPMPGKPGGRVRAHLAHAGGVTFAVKAVDAAGNASEAKTIRVEGSARPAVGAPFNAGRPGRPAPGVKMPKLGGADVAILDELDVVDPARGGLMADRTSGLRYLSNHLWDAGKKQIRLQAARGEAVAFQVLIAGKVEGLTASLTFDKKPPVDVSIGRYETVMTKNGPMHDPIVPLTGPIDVPAPGLQVACLHVEMQVGKDASGWLNGTLSLRSKGDRLDLPVELIVQNFALPDHLSFLPEMNCYGLPENERDFYRLAHRHRTVLNRVPYSHNGSVHDGYAPKVVGKTLDWTEWDRKWGPLFDGSAFADLPRKGGPIELFYLPLFENWPAPIEPNYNGDYWADRAFTPAYRAAFVEASKQIAAHLRQKGWDSTFFECFFNGKNDFKQNGWSRATSPWLLDEPANLQDYWALRYFGGLFHEGINAAPPGKARLVFRADISRPQWQRDLLDDVLDMNIVGGAVREYRDMVMERKHRLGQVVIEYGSTSPVGAPTNLQPVAWSVDAWALGLDGVLPWQTVGTPESWRTADELSLFYPGKNGGPPVPSVRLKAYRRGQQDVEYLTILQALTGEPRWAIGRRVRLTLKSAGARRGTGVNAAEDAGRIEFGGLTPLDLHVLRSGVADEINGRLVRQPPFAKDPVVEFRTPRRDPRPMSDWVVGGANPKKFGGRSQ